MVVTVLTLALARARFRMSGMVDDLARQDVELAEAGDLLKASRTNWSAASGSPRSVSWWPVWRTS